MFKKTSVNAIRGLVAVIGAGLPLAGALADDSASMTVTAQVNDTCTVGTTNTVDFGVIDPAIDNDVASTIEFSCTLGFSPQMIIDSGANGADVNSRAMINGAGDLLDYQLYTNAAGGTVWGDTAGTGKTVTGTGLLNTATTDVYGRVAQADAAVAPGGNYSDTVLVTILF
ncbi:MAG: spore coat U domain-containing protein [Gammaproteobacteria bacterium]